MGQSVFPIPSTLTTKGDLLAYDTAPNRLPVGADGTTLVANSASATGVAWAGPSVAAGKNAVINGGFDIWQRGTSLTLNNSAYQYLPDRWSAVVDANATNTLSQSTDAPTGFTYSVKWQRTAGQTLTPTFLLTQAIENINSIQFAGKPVVVSFYAKVGAYYSGTSQNIYLYSGTGSNQGGNPATWTGATSINSGTNAFTPTTTWQRFTLTGTASSAAKQLGILIASTTSGTAGADDSIYITGVQLEIGSVATPFSRAGGTLSGELAACQRYYFNSKGSTQTPSNTCLGFSTSIAYTNVQFPSVMRAAPTILLYDFNNTVNQINPVGTTTAYTGATATSSQITNQGFIRIDQSGAQMSGSQQLWFYYTAASEL